jgi:hypothetical protein
MNGCGGSKKLDPPFLITHRGGLQQGPELYETFRDKKDRCVKVVLNPVMLRAVLPGPALQEFGFATSRQPGS